LGDPVIGRSEETNPAVAVVAGFDVAPIQSRNPELSKISSGKTTSKQINTE
jgi:hypothetical protein